jgi:putative YhdH/YhfP family quinone oxidoreductase
MTTYRAILINKNAAGEFSSELENLPLSGLPAGELLVRVQYSSLNYKDALSASGNPGVTRNFPHTPGIDAAGVVESSDSEDFQAGQEVIVTGYDLGMNTAGGLAEFIRIPAAWAVPLPAGLSTREAMIVGTAGLTAALCVDKLQRMGLPDGGKVVVSGASGGVGSFAVALLSQLGYLAAASTGSPDAAAFLQALGADQIMDRSVLAETNPRPMGRGEWDGGVDTVGGETLANIIKGLNYGASVAAVGLVGSTELPISVLPFILRDVNLLGVDSVEISHQRRLDIWGKLATAWKPGKIESLATEVGLEAVPELLNDLLRGQVRGRTLVKL